MKKSLSTGKRTQQLHVFQLRQRLCLALSSLVRPFGQKGQMHLKQGQDLDENGELTTPSPISMFVGCFKWIPSLNRMLKLQIRMICLVDKHFQPIRVKSANFTCLLHSSGQHQGLHCDLQRINWIAALRLLRLLPNIIQ